MTNDQDPEYLKALEAQLEARLTKLKNVSDTRKKQNGMDYYVPNAVQHRAHMSTARTILLCGANRIGKCITISTLIDTPLGHLTVGELYKRGKPFEVYAWDGEKKVTARASAPFKKQGLHECYRIEMSDGRFIEAADNHRILTKTDRWAYVSDLYSEFLQTHSFDSETQEKNTLLVEANSIISIEPIGLQEVYDFEVEEYHNYFAGGLINHNSTFGVMELCWHLTKKYPSWFPQSRRFNRPIKAVISVDSFDKIANVIEPKIRDFLPSDYYKIRRKQAYMHRLDCKDGSFVVVLTLEMDDSAYESADWDFVWEDEPQDQRKREGLVRGLVDRRGYEVISFTPLTEAWMKEELIDKADGKRIECFFAQMRDNKFDISGNPILSEESIKEFEESLPEEIKEIRVDGQFFTLRGRVYREFSDAHVSDVPYPYPEPVTCVLDPHDRKPHHVIWAYVDRNDDVFVDYELVVRCELDDLARKIKSIEKARGYKMRKRIIDPNFGLKPAKPGANWSVKDELTKFGTGFYPGNDDVELGHMIVRDYLHYDRSKEMTAVNKPKVFFNRSGCPVTIRSMRNYQYDEWTGKTKNKRDVKEEVQDKDSDGADTVRYLLITKPKFKSLQETSYEEAEAMY